MNAAAIPTRTVHLDAIHDVQTEPLLADQWLNLLNTDGQLVTVVAISHDAFENQRTLETLDSLLACTQAAHVSAENMWWRIVGADHDDAFIRVTNELVEWMRDPERVAAYNAEVAEEHRLTDQQVTATLDAFDATP